MSVADLLSQSIVDVARANADSHPGHELISFGEVAIPFFELKISAEVLDHKPINPFDEFVLRAVSAGVTEVPTMEQLLGLDSRVLETTLVSLVTSDLLRNTGEAEEVSLTETGQEALDTASQVQVRPAAIRVVFDPLLEEVLEPFGDFLQPKELAQAGIKEARIPALRVPDVHRLDISEVSRVIRKMGGEREQARDILALRSMRRFRVYRPAIAMVYRAKGTSDLLMDVSFEDRVSERHSRALAETGAKDKFLGKHAGRDRIGDRSRGLQRAKVRPAPEAQEALAPWALRGRLSAALETVQRQLIITSPGLQSAVLDEDLLGQLDTCAERDVSVHIGWGYQEGARERSDPAAVKALDDLTSKHPNFNVRQLNRDVDNVLISDSAFMISSDFAWLSYLGDPGNTFSDERGLMITDATYIDGRADEWISRLTARPR